VDHKYGNFIVAMRSVSAFARFTRRTKGEAPRRWSGDRGSAGIRKISSRAMVGIATSLSTK
jgi:hypothetical protein